MRLSAILGALAAGMCQLVAATTFEPYQPPSYPLAVRSPYLSAWLPGLNVSNFATSPPQFWEGQNLNLGVMARANGKNYALFSIAEPPNGTTPAAVTDAKFSSTHSVFTLSADSLAFTLDFFSPVSPKNYLRQSLPFSYLTVSVSGAQGGVMVYADFDDSWTGQNTTTTSQFSTSGNVGAFQLSVPGAPIFAENGADMALWGTSVFGASGSMVSSQTGPLADVRSAFTMNGSLSNQNGDYAHGDVVALTQFLSGGTNSSASFAVGYVRGNNTINFNGNARAGYYMTKYPDTMDALSYFFSDYSSANAESQAFDSAIVSAGTNAAGANYSDILELSVRQSYGGLDFTVPSSDLTNTEDFMIFLKEISSDGNVNTIDVLFPAFPIWYVLSPEYIRYTLEPVMQYLEGGQWTEPFMIHDIGSHYPNATGYPNNNVAEQQPVEECGNLQLLAYAYTTATNDTSFINKYRNYFQKYADYLVTSGFDMPSQLATDDGAGPLPNQTNLAIKAAVGLNAFGKMFNLQNYSDVGLNYSNLLYDQGLGTDANKTRFLLQYAPYQNESTFTTTFNLFPDKLLNLSTFNPKAYDMQSAFYPTARLETGVPLDSRVDWAKTDEELLIAAYVTVPETKTMFIDDIHQFVVQNSTSNQVPFSDRWFVTDAQGDPLEAYDAFRARPVSGGHFAVLAMEAGPDSVSAMVAQK
jgi:Domain of unknown function (DUF4965)/Domain of unknown function (DUF5127)/Domain of unknown function (DUF1793)